MRRGEQREMERYWTLLSDFEVCFEVGDGYFRIGFSR